MATRFCVRVEVQVMSTRIQEGREMLTFDWLAIVAVVGLTILRMGLPILALLLAGEVFRRAAAQQVA
jgi:hypothetical protein